MDFSKVTAVQSGDSCVLERLDPSLWPGELVGETGQDCPVGSVPAPPQAGRILGMSTYPFLGIRRGCGS